MTYMFGRDVAEKLGSKFCSCCKLEMPKERDKHWCFECFLQWYDGGLPHPDNLDPIKVANFVRAKRGFPPLDSEK